MESIQNKNCFVFDMDGTVYLEDELLEGAKELFDFFRKKNISYYFLTNNSSKSVSTYIKKLEKMGLPTVKEKIITSTTSTIAYLKENFDIANQYFYLVGTDDMYSEMIENNLKVITELDTNIQNAIVVVGFDTSLSYQKLTGATYYLKRNNLIVASNCDMVCPLKGGEFTPDCGAIVSMLNAVVPSEIKYCGKPDLAILKTIFKQGFKKEDIIIIGDRLYTDIKLGFDNGIDTVLVLTGEDKATQKASNIIPSLTLKNINQLYHLIKEHN